MPARSTPASPTPSSSGRMAQRLRLAALRTDAPTAFEYTPSDAQVAALKERMDLLGLRKMRLTGQIVPEGKADWRLTGHLGVTVVQPCSITLEPVTTRLEEDIARRYTDAYVAPAEGEAEMPEDETLEPLPDAIELFELAEETLALALPAFPRAQGAEAGDIGASPPGAAPDGDAETSASPFAALADLRRKLED